jgi:hypothetical protein
VLIPSGIGSLNERTNGNRVTDQELAFATDWIAGLRARGAKVTRGKGKRGPRASVKLTPQEEDTLRTHREAIKAVLAREGKAGPSATRSAQLVGRPEPPEKPQEPTPVVVVDRYRITEDDVVNVLTGEGNDALADYRNGRMSKADAYERARCWFRQLGTLRAGPARWSRGLPKVDDETTNRAQAERRVPTRETYHRSHRFRA